MTHFGIVCPAASSHLNLMSHLAGELKQRGHRLTVLGAIDMESQVVARGLDFQAVGESEFPPETLTPYLAKLGKMRGLRAMRYTANWISKWLDLFLQTAPDRFKEVGVEALLVDQISFEGGTIAECLGLPFITLCSGLITHQHPTMPPWNTPWMYGQRWWQCWRNQFGYSVLNGIDQPIWNVVNHYRRKWNLPPFLTRNQAYSNLAQITHQPAEFEFPRTDLPEYFHFTGPFHTGHNQRSIPFPYEQLTDQPLIYASLGTILNRQTEVFQKIAAACAGLDVQLVLSLGGSPRIDELSKLPKNCLVVPYAPQLELLQKATLTITHAGMHTTLECLSYGIPMVAIPIINDQPAVAARIAWTGTGEVIPLRQLTVARLRKAIQQVLTQTTYKQNALRLQGAIRQSGGVRKAADIIEKVISSGQPVLAKNLISF